MSLEIRKQDVSIANTNGVIMRINQQYSTLQNHFISTRNAQVGGSNLASATIYSQLLFYPFTKEQKQKNDAVLL